MQRFVFLLFFLVSILNFAQNKQLLYDFESLPQANLLNPGVEMEQKFFFGFPLLSQVSAEFGATPFSAYDLFSVDGPPINSKLQELVSDFGSTEFFSGHQQLELLTGGFRIPYKGMVTFGIYQEANFFVKIPKDVLHLAYYGNTDLDRTYSVEKMHAFGELLNVFHIGYTRSLKNDLTIGGRLKIYSNGFHASSSGASGTITTSRGINNLIAHQISNVNLRVNTSGIPTEEGEDLEPSDIVGRLLLGGNLGMGVDFGFTKHLSDQFKLTGSILDFGFVNYSKEVKNYEVQGDYTFEGAELLFEGTLEDYWNLYREEFNEAIENSENENSYVKMRPLKLNAGMHYSFGKKRDLTCNYLPKSERYLNKLSAHLFAMMSDVHTRVAGTLAYERWFSKHFQAKISYTADSFSFSNIGVGLATAFGPVQFYVLADNLWNLNNLYDAQAMTVQLGLNFNFYDLN